MEISYIERRVPDLVHESKALQFEVGTRQQTVIVLEHPCLWHRNQHPNFKISNIPSVIKSLQVIFKALLTLLSENSFLGLNYHAMLKLVTQSSQSSTSNK